MKYLLFCLFLVTSCNADDNANTTSIFKVEDIDSVSPTCNQEGYMHFHTGDSRYEYGDVILCEGHLCRIIKKY